MNRLTYIREHWPAAMASIVTPFCYFVAEKIKDPTFGGLISIDYKNYVLIILTSMGALISTNIGNYLVKKIILNKNFRNYLNRPYNIEGYWHIFTEFSDENYRKKYNLASILAHNGIMYISYDGDSNEYCIKVRRIDFNGNEIPATESDHCYIQNYKGTVKYINYFTVRNKKILSCICVGKFTSFYDHYPNVHKFESQVYVENYPSLIQNAKKIDNKIIQQMTDQHKDWQIKYLQENQYR